MHIPEVSICMPVFNGMPYLKESLKSVFDQSFKDFEIVVSLDKSNDGTKEYLESLKDSRLKIYYNNNPGLFQNLNNAIAKSKGNFLQIFCQDDIMKQNMIDVQLQDIKANLGNVLVVGREISINSEGFTGSINENSREKGPMTHKLYLWRAAHYGSIASNISCVMVKRSAIIECGMFNENFKFAGDVDLYNRMSLLGSIKAGWEPCLYVRGHDGQTSRQRQAIVGFLKEEREINESFWRQVIAADLFESMLKFRAKTRGVIHLKSALKELLQFRIGSFIRIFIEIRKTYGLRYTIIPLIFHKKTWPYPDFSSEEMRLAANFEPVGSAS